MEIASAPVGPPKDEAERKEWYRQMREKLGKSRFVVDKIPAGYTAYWARKDDENEMSRLDVLGFKIVRDDPKNPRYKANGRREDGTYQLGDVVLMECPTEMYDFYKQDNLERAKNMVQGVPQTFISEAEKKNVPAFEVDEKNKKVR
jgi:hypothetical protein